MNSKGFVKAIELIASSALTGLLKTIAKPPGKSPAPNLVRISELYRSLSDKDKQIFSDALELAARQSINNFHRFNTYKHDTLNQVTKVRFS